MNARVEEPSHRHGIAEHKDRQARPKLMRSLIVSYWGSGGNLCRPSMRAPAACGGGFGLRSAGSAGTGTALRWSRRHSSITSRIHVLRLHATQPKVSRPYTKLRAPLDDVDGREIARSEERPSFDGLCPAMTVGAADFTTRFNVAFSDGTRVSARRARYGSAAG